MSIQRYEKHSDSEGYNQGELQIEGVKKKERLTIWRIFQKFFQGLQSLVNASTLANFIIPGIFIFVGIAFIYQQFAPDIIAFIQEQNGLLDQGTATLVEENYITSSKYISNPENLPELTQQALAQNILRADKVSGSFKGKFYITIPSLKIKRLPVKANVDSTTEKVYMKALESSLAHFRNTGLPISEVKNNIVIYGHSASPSYNPSPSNPTLAFSFLPNLKVGDEIFIDIGGKRYKYQMYKSKIVAPDDTSIITGQSGSRQTLTLFTCFPLGNNTSRYVAVARPI